MRSSAIYRFHTVLTPTGPLWMAAPGQRLLLCGSVPGILIIPLLYRSVVIKELHGV
jgi:hypothetical protein